ncbi:putative selenium-dependent hydroxylase accessory protein YqeC [Natrarchaeobius halalkaliphilus]|uniref:Putative selenium-dependent hydroxylase accessory protein YqeC n=1 Tax=Natrarchaeobius halalkaliphilus TaxID=1679091 RepID=A0A3N6LX35_9EURY|nr:selenium cofactor biosynthesis protein YqeC [Natrarchaeobius halalkaliphilus]RQG86167.1 putative selenium-dependent hydroxylase accessory protein YqeC [Natrarchaeobius halalkaliphilus]
MDVLEALCAESGLVAVVGAGGKKTTLYTLAERAAREGHRSVVTATVRIPIFDSAVERVAITEEPLETLERSERWPVGVVPEREREDRYLGYDPSVIDELAAADTAGPILVKADGARTRDLKAPDEHEPQLPRTVETVVPIASVQVVGAPLTADLVHRPERVAAITGRELGAPIRATDVARVLASDRGGLSAVPEDATVVALLNKVDDSDDRAVGTEIASDLLDRTDRVSHVVLARMIDDDPIVDVVHAGNGVL